MGAGTNPVRLALVPRDGMFFKDGRGWFTSESNHGRSLAWPFPTTVLGALRTAYGRAREQQTGTPIARADWPRVTADVILGPVLALRRPFGAGFAAGHRMWPVPADALYLEGRTEVERLDPRRPPLPPEVQTLGRDDDPAREALWRPTLDDAAKPLVPPAFWPDADFAAWLAGHGIAVRPEAERRSHALPRRTLGHVGIDGRTGTARDGALFAEECLETLTGGASDRQEWALGLAAALPSVPAGLLSRPFTLGGQGRLARPEPLDAALFEPPPEVLAAFRAGPRGIRVVVVSPAGQPAGWLPRGLGRVPVAGGPEPAEEYRGALPGVSGEVVLRAAFVPRAVHVSGWDMAARGGRGAPKATRRLVPAGAVYFFEKTSGAAFDESEGRALWLTALGDGADEGLSRVVAGVWRPTEVGA